MKTSRERRLFVRTLRAPEPHTIYLVCDSIRFEYKLYAKSKAIIIAIMTSTTGENESQTDIIDKVNQVDCNVDDDDGSDAGEIAKPAASTPTKEDYEYVIDGLSQWLNNKPNESETFFKSKSDSTTILVGYAFVLCMVNEYT